MSLAFIYGTLESLSSLLQIFPDIHTGKLSEQVHELGLSCVFLDLFCFVIYVYRFPSFLEDLVDLFFFHLPLSCCDTVWLAGSMSVLLLTGHGMLNAILSMKA